jgi:glycosyltransferase involved in cell wall biosynthesis
MPLYNKSEYVLRAIKSVQIQSYRNWELIIVDDGSTDGSTEEIPQDDSRIHLLRQQNKGPSAARNKGIAYASGNYITFLDADDSFFANKLEVETDLLSKNSANWVISTGEYAFGEVKKVRRLRAVDLSPIAGGVLVYENAFKQLSLSGIPVNGLCIRARSLKRAGGFEESMSCYEITEFIVRFAMCEPRVVVHADPLYCVNDVPDSAFKNRLHVVEGKRQLGEAFFRLSSSYPHQADTLISKSKNNLLSYVTTLILAGNKIQARRYLMEKYPFEHNIEWWKQWVAALIPTWILRIFYKSPQ